MGAESKDPEDISIRKCRVKAFSRKSYVSSVARDPLYLYSVVCADLRDIFFKKYFSAAKCVQTETSVRARLQECHIDQYMVGFSH